MAFPQPPETTPDAGPVPADNQPGHHPSKEQDKPDLDAFARRLGVAEPAVDQDDTGTARSKPAALIGVAVAAVLALVGVVLLRRRRSARG